MRMILEEYPKLKEIEGKQVTPDHGSEQDRLPQQTLSRQHESTYRCESDPAESKSSWDFVDAT